MKKRVLSALLALCMACTLAGNVWAAEETEPTPAPSAGVEAQTVEPQTVEPTPSAEPTQAPAPSPDATAEPEATPEPSAAPSAAPDATVEPDATPAPTEEPEATDAPAPSETPSATPAPTAEAEGEQVADGVEYAAVLEQDGQALNVIVTAPEGAFDAGVTPALSVTAIEDEAEGDAIAAKLDESGVTYDGFAALDISFKNEAGEEIEPKLPVTVRIELPEAIVDSGIDLNTLAVQHLAEDEAGNVTAVEQVASVADGTIALSEEAVAAMEAAAQAAEESNEAAIAPMMLAAPANDALTPDADTAEAPAVAEFEVNGFSTFTITWGDGDSVSIDILCVDESGTEIGSDRQLRQTDAFSLKGVAPKFDNYEYLRAEVVDYRGEATEIQRLRYEDGWFGGWQYSTYESENANRYWEGVGYSDQVRLVYASTSLGVIATVNSIEKGIHINLYDYDKDAVSSNTQYGHTNWGVLGNFDFGAGSPDRNEDYVWNKFNSGNSDGARQGIMKNVLTGTFPEQYPEFNTDWTSNREKLGTHAKEGADWLFTSGGAEGKTEYKELNHLFVYDEEKQTYSYDSSQHFASIVASHGDNTGNDKDFVVYDRKFQPGADEDNKNFMPLNDLTASGKLVENANYLFGMEVYFQFNQPEAGQVAGQDMIFEFNGDDDVWVYIDGVLVLDMGGIHGEVTGSINFATGTVTINKVKNGEGNSVRVVQVTEDLKTFFDKALGEEASNEIEWVELSNENHTFADYSNHDFKFFYLERGEGGSNCEMKFNLPTIPAGTVAVNKQVNNGATTEQKTAAYTMQLLVKDSSGNFVEPEKAIENYSSNAFTVGGSLNETQADKPLPGNGQFTVTGGSSVYIHNIPANTVYKIQELNVSDDTQAVLINNEPASVTNGTAATEETFTVGRNSAVTVTNRFPVAPPEDFDITTGKRADLNEDGTYDLTLSTSGDIASVEGEQIKADILFVVDRSTSMWDDYRDYGRWETSKSRMEVLKEAITGLVTEIESNDAIDANYNMVQFGTGSYNKKLLGDKGWTDASSKISNVLASIQGGYDDYYGGVGTNYQAGIKLAKEELQFVRDDARTYVIFLTDGDPTFHYTENGAETGGGSYTQPADIENAVKEIQGLSCDNFYAIGVSDDYTEDNLDRLCGKSSSHPNENGVNATIAQVYGASEDGDLPAIFDSIISEMTFFAAENVVMHDTLSQWADVPNASDVKFTVKLEHREQVNNQDVWREVDPVNGANKVVDSGESVHYTTTTTGDEGNPTTTDVYIIPTYDANSKTITVQLADNENGNTENDPSTYKLAPDYRYSVMLKIKPSDAAIREGMEGGHAEEKPDDYTGTHAEADQGKELGFWSNDNKTAKVTYTVGDIPREKEFPKPVIQVQETFGDLELVKKVVDGSASAETVIDNPKVPGTDGGTVDADYTFIIKATGDLAEKVVANTDGYEISDSTEKVTFTESGEDATATVTVKPGVTGVTIADLPTGTYTITEENPAAEVTRGGKTYYYVSNNAGNGVEANVKEDETATATITNTYKPYKSLTIEKSMTGAMASSDQTFTIEVQKTSGTLENGDVVKTTENDEKVTGIDFAAGSSEEKDKITITTKADGQVTLNKLRDGDVITITETNPTANGYNLKTINIPSDSTVGDDGETVITPKSGFVASNNMVTVTMSDVTVEGENIGNIEFVNERDVVTPTGLESNHTKPYALMVGAGALAGLALVGGILARRARRRREW